ncbi:oligopeptide ABC transporter permease [Escherichia coli]|nr:oligopeptide ABC transporter permease [Escherichia coli]
MLKFILRRCLEAIPTLFILITISFFMMRLAPGSPFTGERTLPPEVMANIEAKYHLNDPIMTQYFSYLKQLAHGDFGPSFKYKDYSVNDLVASSFPVSAKLGAAAFFLAVILGVSAGVIAALKQNTKWDYTVMGLAMTGVVIPSFVVAPLLVMIFAIILHWLPGGGWNGGALKFMILPMVALSLAYIASIARITRGSMIEVLHSNFIRTARAKGLPMRRIILRHALKPALLPVLSYMGPAFVGIITGSMVIETIYGLPGIGQLFVNGALNRDYSLVLSLTILVGALTILFNAIVDVLYAVIDPENPLLILELAMMLSKKNSETLENFSEKLEVEGRSLWQDARRRFMHNRAAVASLIVLVLIALFVILAPMLSQFAYDDTDWAMMSSAPDMESGHYFGTDSSGRDLLVRVAIGGRISLMVGVAAALVAVVVGTLYGSLSGYLGGKVDSVMMRLLEILNSFPFMFFVILLVTFFGQNILLIFVAIGMVSWLDMARIVRGQTLSLKRKEFIEAAQVGGVSTSGIVIRHIVPNVLGVVVVYASLLVPSMILFESFLSFLGLGTQEPLSSWGALLSDGANSMEVSPWLLLFPAGFLVVTLFCFNFIGDGLRDALDPKDR